MYHHGPARRQRRAGAIAGVPVVLVAAMIAGLAIGVGPAYADVTSGNYIIGSPTPAVTDLAVAPSSARQSASTSFEVTFKASATLSGANDNWVTVAPSMALGSTPAKVQLIGGQCLQAGTAGAGGDGTASTTGVTVELKSSCSIGAGSTVEVDFEANAPSSTGRFQFSVTTSGNSTPASSNSFSVGPSGPVLSALSYHFGDNTKYTVDDVAVNNLTSDGTSVTIKAIVTEGSAAVAFYNGTAGYSVSYVSSAGRTATDPVQKAVAEAKTVTLTLADAVADGGTLGITIQGTNPNSGKGTESNAISVQPGNGTVESSNSVVFGNSVSAVTTSVSTASPGAEATYVVGFKAADAVATGGAVYLSEEAGPTGFSSSTGVLVVDTTARWHFVATGTTLKDGTATIDLADPISAGDSLSITLLDVTNPPNAGTIGDFAVSTSADQVAANAAPYYLGVGANPRVVVSVDPSGTGALAVYTISGLDATGAISAGTTITLQAPKGTVLPNDVADYSIEDSTTSTGSGTASAIVSGGGTNDVSIKIGKNLAAGNVFSLTVQHAVNPSSPSSNYAITLLGDVTGAPPTTTTTTRPPTTTPPTTTTVAHKKPRPKPVVSALTTKVDVHAKKVSLKLKCRQAMCRGTVKLVDVKTVMGAKAYDLKAGKSGTVKLTLDSKGIRLLERAKHHTVRAKQTVSVKGGKQVSKRLTVVGGRRP